MTIRMKTVALAAGLAFGSLAHAGSFPDDVPALGYSPANMDKNVSPRQDFYHYAAGNWLKQAKIAGSDVAVGGFTCWAITSISSC
jgi:predicted metalloendopeptidase